MPRFAPPARRLPPALVAAACAVAAWAVPAAAAPHARVSLVYDTDAVAARLASPPSGVSGLSPARGAYRQAPGSGGMFTTGAGHDTVAKVSGAELRRLTARQMAHRLKALIAHGNHGARAHMVGVDELGIHYADARPRRVVRGAPLPRVRAGWPGARFTAAMRMLDTPSPYGGTWASRVHVYLAPAVHSSIAAGRGPQRNLGRDGKPHLRSWRAVMPGLALAGGIHLQMYHARAGRLTPFRADQWRRVPGAFTGLLRGFGGTPTTVHFIFSSVGIPVGTRSCRDATACTWALAESTPAGRRVLANGPGVYRIGADADRWLAEFNRRFPEGS